MMLLNLRSFPTPKTFRHGNALLALAKTLMLSLLLVCTPLCGMAQKPATQKSTAKKTTVPTAKKASPKAPQPAPAKGKITPPASPKNAKPAPASAKPAQRGAQPVQRGGKPAQRGAQPAKKQPAKVPLVVADTKQIRQLKGDRQALKKQIDEAEQILKNTKSDVQSQLGALTVLNTQIGQQRQYVDGIITEVSQLSNDIGHLTRQLDTLRRDLTYRKNKYAKSVQYMHRNRMTQSNVLFVLSAHSFREMRRRLRYVRAFAKYQREQGEIIRQRELLVREREAQLRGVKFEKDKLLNEGRSEQVKLERQQVERQKVVEGLNQKEAELQKTIATQRAQAAALDAKIDQMVQAEIAKAEARRRAEEARIAAARAAEAKRKAEEAKRKAEEEKRRAAAEAKRQREEAERKRAEEAKKRREAEQARLAAERAKAEGRRREAEAKREEADRLRREADQAKAEKQRAEQAEKQAERDEQRATTATPVYVEPASADRQMSNSFAANRGRLPAPISGSYAITSRFGSYAVEGLRGVQLDNKGINLTSRSACSARAVFNGEVSTIFFHGGMYNIIVRHGSYMTVYCNLSSVSVGRGQNVSTGQTLGAIAPNGSGGYTLHFELRHEMSKLNPEGWFR